MFQEIHISSFIVQVRPEHLKSVEKHLDAMHGVDVFQISETGKIIITLETHTTWEISQYSSAILDTKGVLSCNMVYHHAETEAELQSAMG